jgi:hypothetical protein
MPRDLSDYIQVNERIIRFKEAFPEGSLQSQIVELTEERVVMRGEAYRTPDDPRPGVGHSWLEIPGKTPFTRGSEIENAETSAWGRALAALGFEVKRGIASMEEIAIKEGDEEIEPSALTGVGRGGRTEGANAIQIRRARLLSRQLDLGATGFRDAIHEYLGIEIALPDEEEAAQETLAGVLKELTREQIETLIGQLFQRVTASDPSNVFASE